VGARSCRARVASRRAAAAQTSHVGKFLGLLVIVASTSAMVSCGRSSEIWSGVEFQKDGTLKLAAEEPFCGCLSVLNTGDTEVMLRATLNGVRVGQAALGPHNRGQYRFDWAGPEAGDAYVIEVTGSDGNHLDARKTLQVDDRPRFVECEATACEDGELSMNAAQAEQ
jgi:hypothetical protein